VWDNLDENFSVRLAGWVIFCLEVKPFYGKYHFEDDGNLHLRICCKCEPEKK
jgi:hypothetical protein